MLKLLATCVVCCLSASALAAARPNIVLIVADDLGWNDIGYNNPEMRTPNLNRLASAGVRFTQHYVMPQCTPTRVALMTGCYPSRFGRHCCQASNAQAYPVGTPTIASVLKSSGYRTALTGKWHMGSKPESGPNHYGFDSSYGSLAGAVGMYDHRYRLRSPFSRTWHRDHDFIDEVGHATDLVTKEAVRLLKQEGNAPLFLYVPLHAVHTPLAEEPKWLDQNRHHERTDRMLYAAAVTHMDDCVGRIVTAVEKVGKMDNTLFLFISDNGAQVSSKGGVYPPPDPALTNFSSNAPLRGRKTEVYEGGIRVPAFVCGPGVGKPGVCDTLLHAVDWLPTLSRMTGVDTAVLPETDGQDVWSAINGDAHTAKQLSHRRLYWVWGGRRDRVALRQGPWKLLRNRKQGAWQLFNLKDDPNEQSDLASHETARVEAMKAMIREEKLRDHL